MRLSIETNFPQVQRELQALRKEIAGPALARAVNKVAALAKTAMARQITSEFNIKSADVKARLFILKASVSASVREINATLYSNPKKGGAPNLIHFSARKSEQGVSVKIKKRGARKTVTGAFIANKGRTVFRRVEGTTMRSRAGSRGVKHREKIEPVRTIDVPQMFNTRRINAKVVQTILERLPDVFAHEAAFATARFNSTGRP